MKQTKKHLTLLCLMALLSSGCTSIREVTFTTERIEKVGNFEGFPKQGFQGMSVYGDYLVSLQNTGLATLYRLTDSGMESIRQFPLASRHEANHANVADFGIERKADNSPLTRADKAAHARIMTFLEPTGIPVLSEEGAHLPYEERRHWHRLWIVDPLMERKSSSNVMASLR